MSVLTVVLSLIVAFASFCMAAQQRARVKKTESERARFEFNRLNEVEGVLTVDGKKIRTYNVGCLSLDEIVDVYFHDHSDGSVVIMDIEYNGQSLFSFASLHSSYKEKAEFALQTLKQMMNQKKIEREIVQEVEMIMLDCKMQNKHVKEGHLSITEHDDFVWHF
jgi:hypothetical protein